MADSLYRPDSKVLKARHALGLDRSKVVYRNFYKSGAADSDLDDLAERGFAEKRKNPVSEGFVYRLSKQGAGFYMNEDERFDGETRFPIIGDYPTCEILGYET